MVGIAMTTASFSRSIMHLYLCVGVIGGMYCFFWGGDVHILKPGKHNLISQPVRALMIG